MKKFAALFIALALIPGLCACTPGGTSESAPGTTGGPDPAQTAAPTKAPAPTQTPASAPGPEQTLPAGSTDEHVTVYTGQSDAEMFIWRAIAEETGLDPVIRILGERDVEAMYRGKLVQRHVYDIEVRDDYAVGVIYEYFTQEEFEQLQDWQNMTGIQVIYPYVDPVYITRITDTPNCWYQVDEQGMPVLDDNGEFIPAYSTDAQNAGARYFSIRIPGDDGSFVYSCASTSGRVKCRVCFYTYNIYLTDG